MDTDVYSVLWLKPNDTRAKLYAPHVKGKTIAISFITLGELRFWGHKRKWSKKKWDELERRLRSTVIVPYDDALCNTYAELKNDLPAGQTVAANDLWIAASAVRHALSLISHNRKHFEHIKRLKLISEDPIIVQIQTELFDKDGNPILPSEPEQPS